MKRTRLELRLDRDLRGKLDELAEMAGKPASVVVRRLILAAHRDAFGDQRASADVRRATAQTVVVTEPDDSWDCTEDVLMRAGIPLEPDPQADNADELTSALVTVTAAEIGT